MNNRRQFQLGLALAILGAIGLAVSIPWLVSRLRHRNITTMRLVAQIEEPNVLVNGEPLLVERVPPEGEDVGGQRPVLRLHWRGATHDFPMIDDNVMFEPGLKKYGYWFGVVVLADGAATEEEFERMWSMGGPEPFLVAVARYPAQGYEGTPWNEVRRQEWIYEFARLHLDGHEDEPIEIARKPYEQVDALFLPGKYTDKKYLPTPEERERDLWQYYAMNYVTPPGQIRGRNKVIDPLMREMGLAWPAAGTSILAIMLGILLVAMSRRERAELPLD